MNILLSRPDDQNRFRPVCRRVGTRLPALLLILLIMAQLYPAAAQSPRLRLVASFSILGDVAAQVAGDAADVTVLMPLDADPHSFTPAPRDLVTLAEADAVLLVGAGFEASLLDAVSSAGDNLPLITVSDCVNILPFAADTLENADSADTPPPVEVGDHAGGTIEALCARHHLELQQRFDLGEATESDEAPPETLGMLYALPCDGAAGAGDAHDHAAGTCDPHVWSDPYNVMLWTLMIRDTLVELDPDHADLYQANARAYLDELHALALDVQAQIDSIPPERRLLVTNHQTLNYYAHAFGLTIAGTVLPGGSTLAEPGAAAVARLIDDLRAEGISAIFAETTANPQLAEQIARETGIAVHTLYTGSLSAPDGPAATYLDYLRYNTRVIVAALADDAAAG